jgi:hypothetical protein
MSAYKRYQCNLVDKNTLLKALQLLGFTPEIHDESQRLHGIGGRLRTQKAEIVVTQQELNQTFTGASNDLGFEWDPKTNQYTMIISDYDLSSKVAERVKQAYVKVAIEKALADEGFYVETTASAQDLQSRRRKDVSIVASKLI